MRRFIIAAAALAVLLAASAAGASSHTWNEVTSPHVSGNASEIYAMTATGAGDVWAFGYDRANIAGTFEWRALGERWNGSSWTRVNTLDRETAPAHDFIYGASASGPNDVWIVGQSDTSSSDRTTRNLVEHWNGSAWSIDNTVPDPGVRRGLLAVSVQSDHDVWAVGGATFAGGSDYNGFVLERFNSTWGQVPFNLKIPGCNRASRSELDAVDAIGVSDVYVAGWCQSQPIGSEHGFVAHWNGGAWALMMESGPASALTQLATAPDGTIWVAGNTVFRGHDSETNPLVYHGDQTIGFTQVPVRHSDHFGGPVGALSVSSTGVFIAGQLTDPNGNPTQTYALRLRANGKWQKEPVDPVGGQGYARLHAAAMEPTGTLWLGGTRVGGPTLDVGALVARRN